MKTLLLTGGAGYIGSHTCVELIESGFGIIVVDNLSNSSEKSLKRIEQITGKTINFIKGDVRDYKLMTSVFKENSIYGVIHFAGLKAVGESNTIPLEYYDNNLNSTLNLLKVMKENKCFNFIFSSSATVYGIPKKLPLVEDMPLSVTNPYGQTKLMIENILKDLSKAEANWNIVILRYFNPVGAHASGLIGEDPNGMPNNLLPFITQVAVGKLKELSIFGNDYDTHDGTGVRDYIHVVDLARGHVAGTSKLVEGSGLSIYNLGSGHGYSVLDMLEMFSKVCNQDIPYKIVGRREGDVGKCFADPTKANLELNWRTEHDLEDICRDAWKWQSLNPNGYRE